MIPLRILISAFALISLFFFPWPVTVLLMLAASLVMPVLGIALGAFGDIMYLTPGAGSMPLLLLSGAACTLIALLMHRFVKTRIMEG